MLSEIVEQKWLVRGLIPRYAADGTAGYLFGPAKARKSLFLADVALSVTTGTRALGAFAVEQTGTAVGFFAEDPKGETARRIHRLARGRGVEVPSNLYLIDIPALALDNPEHQERLAATLQGVPDLVFCWLDPFVRLHAIDDNRANELGPIHSFLRTLARSCPSAVFVIAHHANKLGESRGSTDFNAFGDFNLYARAPDELTTEVFRLENRGGPPGQPFQFSVEDGHSQAGATMRLVVPEPEKAMSSRDAALEAAISVYCRANPNASGRDCQEHIRDLGLKIKNDVFWEIWKGVRR
jgi:RecA-family ATPase